MPTPERGEHPRDAPLSGSAPLSAARFAAIEDRVARLPATAGTGGGAYRSFQGQEHLPLRDHHVRNGHADIVRERIDGVTGS